MTDCACIVHACVPVCVHVRECSSNYKINCSSRLDRRLNCAADDIKERAYHKRAARMLVFEQLSCLASHEMEMRDAKPTDEAVTMVIDDTQMTD